MGARGLKKVVGVGLACLDQVLSWKSMDKPLKGNQVVGYAMQGGGMVATALVAVSRLGGKAEFWGAVGADRTGKIITDELQQEGVDISQVRALKGREGPINIVCVHAPTGERYFFRGLPFSAPQKNLGDLERLNGAGCLLVDGCHLSSALRAARRARKLNINVVSDLFWINDARRELLAAIDYAVFPEYIARSVGAGKDLRRACLLLKKMGAGTVVFTLGAKGLVAFDGEQFIEKKAYPVTTVDTTGAGDTFHGAFCFGLINGLALSDNLSFASAVAALKCRKLGGRTGIPGLSEVLKFLKQHEPLFAWPH